MAVGGFTSQAVAELRGRLDGSVIVAGERGFDRATACWSLAHAHRPALVVEPVSTADVVAAVSFATRHDLGVGVHATGHGLTRSCDDGLLIATRRMDAVRVVPDARTAWVGAGATWGAVLEPAQSVGLAPLLGSTPAVGAVGYTLGGGLGWLARAHGPAADAVHWLEVVTADGEVVRASARQHPELFWAVRGGGAGSLGVVTGMEIDLVPVTDVYGGNLLYPIADAPAVLRRWRDWIADAPPELTSSIVLMHFPPIEDVPAPVRGRSFVMVRGCWCGSVAEGERLVTAWWRRWRAPELDMFGPMPFAEVATISNDPVEPMLGGVTTEWLADLDDATLDAVCAAGTPGVGPTPLAFVEVRHVGPGGSRRAAAPAAFDLPGELLLEAVAAVPDATMLPAVREALEQVRTTLAPHVTGRAYLNFLEGGERVARAADGFSREAWGRLAAVKRRYDPTNVFRHGLDLTGAAAARPPASAST